MLKTYLAKRAWLHAVSAKQAYMRCPAPQWNAAILVQLTANVNATASAYAKAIAV